MANKDQPVVVGLTGGLLTITVGVSALMTALRGGSVLETAGGVEAEVSDEDAFARAIVRELDREEEDGTTPIHRLFDSAALAAIEDGAEGVRFPGEA